MCQFNPDCDRRPVSYVTAEPCVVVLGCCGTRVPSDDGTPFVEDGLRMDP